MYTNLKIFTSRFATLSEEEIEALLAIFNPKPIKRLDHLFTEGSIVKELYFINEGVMRGYYVKDGKEITTNFYFGPTMMTDISTIRKEIPTLLNIQALKTCDCLAANFAELEALAEQYPNINEVFFKFMEHLYMFGFMLQLTFIYDTPQERYIKLFSERPKVIAESPQHYIASYLGIKPETLSRIRKRIM